MTAFQSEFWTLVRFVLLYPLLAACGISWCVVFFMRWRMTRCIGDQWAAAIGASLAIWALASITALLVSKTAGFGNTSSFIVTVGIAAPAAVLVVFSAQMFFASMRKR